MTVCSMTRSKVKVTGHWKSKICPFSKAISPPPLYICLLVIVCRMTFLVLFFVNNYWLEAFLHRCTRLQLYRQRDPTVNQLVEDMEDKLFTSVINNDKHVLSHILPDPNNHTYNLRPRRRELTLAIKGDARNVFERQLVKDIYWSLQFRILYFIFYSLYCVVFRFYCAAAFWQRILHIKLNWIEFNTPNHPIPSQAGTVRKRLNRSSSALALEASLGLFILHCFGKEFRYLQK